jgi:hypothetical protein
MKRLVRSAVKNNTAEKAKMLSQTLYLLSAKYYTAPNTKKAIQTASTSKRKASKVFLPKRKPKKAKGGSTAVVPSPEAALAAPLKVSSYGRTINLAHTCK